MEQLARTWRALAKVLRREMGRRGLWNAPPSFVGAYGWQDWRQPGALDDLTQQCFSYVFVQRLRSLKAQLQVKDNVDGLVFRNVRNFLYDLQREHDPVGHRAYEVLRGAVDTALADGVLERRDGGSGGRRVGGGTRLAFRPPAGTAAAAGEPDTEEREHQGRVLAEHAGQWNTELLPDLILARGRQRDAVARRLAERLPRLAAEGIESFRFGDLLGHLRADLRQRWAAILWQEGGAAHASRQMVEHAAGGDAGADTGFVRVLSLYRPPPSPGDELAQRQVFRRLTDCVSRLVEAAPGGERARAYLDRLWQFIRTCAKSSEPVPSRRKLARFLDIPRDRMPELHQTLADFLRRCREAAESEGRGGDLIRHREPGRDER